MSLGNEALSPLGTHLAGVRAAYQSAAWLAGDGWKQLVRLEPGSTPPSADMVEAIRPVFRTTVRTLGLLSRIPGGNWQRTCLFRCVAVTLVLRRYGIPSRLCIGATSDQEVKAHAWVESPDGTAIYETRGAYRELA